MWFKNKIKRILVTGLLNRYDSFFHEYDFLLSRINKI
jgi:hypothetical protein